jgi:hypothetical protein
MKKIDMNIEKKDKNRLSLEWTLRNMNKRSELEIIRLFRFR